jgi:hypothetical protein
MSKVFPYTDSVCPPDGICHESTQVLVKMSMVQETDVSKKPKNFFQTFFPNNQTRADSESLNQLILKNETSTTGDVFMEGTIKQIKDLLKNHIVVKPACMFDSKIQVNFKVSYQHSGKYNDYNSREVNA